jgi:hypothetical protein
VSDEDERNGERESESDIGSKDDCDFQERTIVPRSHNLSFHS